MNARSTILVIEDDPLIQANILELLSEEGYQTIAVSNGMDGIRAALAVPPDLVLCDVAMSGMEGIEVLVALRSHAHTASVPFVFLSARAETAAIERGLQHGADAYLTKPFTRAALLGALDAHLPKRLARGR